MGIPFTNDLLALGSNAAISDAIIEQAMNNGKTDAEINEAMADIWIAKRNQISSFSIMKVFARFETNC